MLHSHSIIWTQFKIRWAENIKSTVCNCPLHFQNHCPVQYLRASGYKKILLVAYPVWSCSYLQALTFYFLLFTFARKPVGSSQFFPISAFCIFGLTEISLEIWTPDSQCWTVLTPSSNSENPFGSCGTRLKEVHTMTPMTSDGSCPLPKWDSRLLSTLYAVPALHWIQLWKLNLKEILLWVFSLNYTTPSRNRQSVVKVIAN